ncbi:MAG: sodium-dependent transporter [Rikenellaceae bacterium]
MSNNSPRAVFGSSLTAMLVTAGCSVGLGNIWRFPYLVGEGGGAAFIIIYLLAVIFIGHPIMLAEFAVGRSTHKNAVGAYSVKDKRWGLLGYNGVFIAFVIMGFYFVVAGWTIEYMVNSADGAFTGFTSADEYTGFFSNYVSGVWTPLIYTWIFILISHSVIALGVQKGIERATKVLMPALFIILIVLAITSIRMPNSEVGLKYLFVPDFSKVTSRTIINAVGQVFFSLSVGMGCLTTYASYFSDKTDIRKTATQLTIVDTIVALLASVIILPAVFSVGIEPTSGPSLVFITLPGIFNTLPFPELVSTIFFMLLFIAALTSTISLHEVVTAYLIEERKMTRVKAVSMVSAATVVMATLASLSLGVLSEFKIFGYVIFDLFDALTSNLLLPMGGVMICVYASWILGDRFMHAQLSNESRHSDTIVAINIFLLRYVSPVAVFILFLDGIGVFKMFR